ncbi:MAG: ATP-binding protein [Chloroherpetonaceae bacterium]
MSRFRRRKPITLLCFLTACAVCVAGIVSTASRLNLEPKSFEKGDVLLSVWNIPIESESHRLFLFRLLDTSLIKPVMVERLRERKVYRITFDGETQEVIPTVVRDTLTLSLSVPTVKRFGVLYMLGSAIACAVFLFGAFFVERKSAFNAFDDRSAPFSLAAMLIAVMIATAHARFEQHLFSIGNALHVAFLLAYTLSPVFFFRWSLAFPKASASHSILNARILFFTLAFGAILLSLQATLRFHEAISEKSYSAFEKYQTSITLCGVFFSMLMLGALFNFARAYTRLQAEGDLRRLRWTLVGTSIGMLPFVLLSLFPRIIFERSFIPDELAVVLALPTPLMLGIAITRYRLLDIDALFNQSFTFLTTLVLLGAIYGAVVFLLSHLFVSTESYSPYLVAAFAAILVLIFFEPMKARVQAFANEHIFKARFNAERAEAQLSAEIQRATSEDDLAETLARSLHALLDASSVAITFITHEGNRLKLYAEKNFIINAPRSIAFSASIGQAELVARKEQLEDGVDHQLADESRFERWRLALAVPIQSERRVMGYLLLGEKNSQLAFNAEEVRLLQSVATQAAIALARVRLQRDLALKSEEARRLQELSDLKSYFVSSVSHDLRTPLTSIKLFAELLSAKTDDPTSKKYLAMIEGESERLSKMVSNILRFAKSEKGIDTHHFETLNLSALAEEALNAVSYQLELGCFEVKTHFNEEPLLIEGDKPSLLQAIENLISNAMKYSGESKVIEVATFKTDTHAVLSVKDFGIGISPADQARLFEPFFRSPDERAKRLGGVGLGLALVKNTMNAHHGDVLVKSLVGIGSEFELHFPPKAS